MNRPRWMPIPLTVLATAAVVCAQRADPRDLISVTPLQALGEVHHAYASGEVFRDAERRDAVGPGAPEVITSTDFDVVTIEVAGRGPDMGSIATLASGVDAASEPAVWLTLGELDPLGVLVTTARVSVVRLEEPTRGYRLDLAEGADIAETIAELLPAIPVPQFQLALEAAPEHLFPHAGSVQWLGGTIDVANDPDHTVLTGVSDRGEVRLTIAHGTQRVAGLAFETHDDATRITVRSRPAGVHLEDAELTTDERRALLDRGGLRFSLPEVSEWVETLEGLWSAGG